MANFTIKRIDEMEAIFHGGFKRARAELGVTSFGMQVIDLPPGSDLHPEHSDDTQEEVYVTLRGSGEIEIDGERHPLNPDLIACVAPDAKRKLWPGDEGMRVLALGGIPGTFEPAEITVLGSPDPYA